MVFDGFEFDREGCQLFRAGVEVSVERRVLDLLCYLVAHPGRLVGRDELLEQVWHVPSLSEGVLANTLAKLRKAIGQPADAREPIETVRGRGYRFHGVPRGPSPSRSSAPPAEPASDPFVGRRYALAQLSSALERCASGEGEVFVVAGEAGIGKTRLVRELKKLARARGFSVWSAAAYEGGAVPAYWPWVEVLRRAREQMSESAWRQTLPARPVALAKLVPELCTHVAGAAADAQSLRFMLFDELTRFLTAASHDAPLLVVLDDLHWADAATTELLAHAACALERRRLMFVATLRDRDPGLDAQCESLRRLERVASWLRLDGLSSGEVAELTLALVGAQRDEARLVEALCQRTQGNPLFVRQMLGWLAQRGALSGPDVLQLSAADMPPALQAVIQQRIQGLSEETCAVLSLAAVAGREFDASLIADILGRSLEQVLGALERAIDLRIVEQQAALAPHVFAFTHDLLCDALRDSLGATQRGLAHAKWSRALLARGAARDARRSAEIARHLLLAVPSDLESCTLHCCNAAAAARASSGFEAAAELLLRLTHKHASEGGDPHVRCELLLTLAADQFSAGDARAAWDTLRHGAELARQLEAAALLARFAIRLAPWAEFGGGDEAYVRTILDQSLRSLDAEQTDLRAGLLAHQAELESERPLRERIALLDEAERLAAQRATPEVLLQIAYTRAALRAPITPADNREAIERFRTLDARHRRGYADPLALQRSFFVEWLDYRNALTQCQLAAADAAAARCRRIAQGAKTRALDFLVALLDAGRALGDGRLSDLETSVKRLREVAPVGGAFGPAWIQFAVLHAYERGALAHWVDEPRARREFLRSFPDHQHLALEIAFAWTAAQAGDIEAAARLVSVLPRAALARMPRQRGDLDALCVLSEVYSLVGDRDGAAFLLPRLEPFAALNAVGAACEYRGAVAHYLGLLSALLGDTTAALAYFDRAESLNEALHMPLQLARTRAQRTSLLA